MVKVKAYIADLALCVHDADATIARMSRLFFHELSQKGACAVPRHHTFPVRAHSKTCCRWLSSFPCRCGHRCCDLQHHPRRTESSLRRRERRLGHVQASDEAPPLPHRKGRLLVRCLLILSPGVAVVVLAVGGLTRRALSSTPSSGKAIGESHGETVPSSPNRQRCLFPPQCGGCLVGAHRGGSC
jgi:hypothetical protein